MGNWKIISPEATTNLITNPSLESGTTGWTTDGTNTIAQSDTLQKFGHYSLKATYNNDLDLARYAITLTAAAHTFSCWVYLPSNWDGGAVKLNVENFTSVTIDTATTTTTTTGSWQYLQISFTPDSGDLTGDLVIEAASAPTATRFIYIDAAQCEAKAYATTYCDGDQPGCEWTTIVYGSTSTRDATSRYGGRVKDLGDDYSFHVEQMIGAGIPDIKNVAADRSMSHGSDFITLDVPERELTLIATMTGNTLADLHSKRQALILAVAPDRVRDEPVLLRYTGSAVDKELYVRYQDGLTLSGPNGYTERVALEFLAIDDPLWKQIGNNAIALTEHTTVTHKGVIRRRDGVWSGLSATSGTYVNAIAWGPDEKLYVGGNFLNWDGIANADYIVMWDGSSWNALSTGCNNVVHAIFVLPNGNVLIGGQFTTAGGVSCLGLAEWNGSTFSAFGSPSSGGSVYHIVQDSNGDIYIAGEFQNWNGNANADRIVRYDYEAGTWNAMGTGINNPVNGLALDEADRLFIGGQFTDAGGVTAHGLAMWDGSTYTALNSADNSAVYALLYDRGILYVGGNFTKIGGEDHNRIVAWNGSSFTTLGSGIDNSTVWGLTKWRDKIVASGWFTTVDGGRPMRCIAYWNGSGWVYPDIELVNEEVQTVESDSYDNLFLGMHANSTEDCATTTTITPGGTARTFPILTVKNSSATGQTVRLKSIINETTGKEVFMDYYLLIGETLTINFNPNNFSAVSSSRGAVWPFLAGGDVGNFYLQPGIDNTIAYFCGGSATAVITTHLSWQDTYWSID